MVDAPASSSAASRSLARRRNECTRQGRLWLPGPARRAGPRLAAQAVTLARTPDALLPGWRAQAVGTRIGRIVRTERRSRGPVSGLRAPPPADCRNAGIMQYCAVSAPRCRSGRRRGAAELGRLASGAVTPGEPGANRQPGRPRPPPQPAGATMRSSRGCAEGEPGGRPVQRATPTVPLIGRDRRTAAGSRPAGTSVVLP
jgi:hypothetical protein